MKEADAWLSTNIGPELSEQGRLAHEISLRQEAITHGEFREYDIPPPAVIGEVRPEEREAFMELRTFTEQYGRYGDVCKTYNPDGNDDTFLAAMEGLRRRIPETLAIVEADIARLGDPRLEIDFIRAMRTFARKGEPILQSPGSWHLDSLNYLIPPPQFPDRKVVG